MTGRPIGIELSDVVVAKARMVGADEWVARIDELLASVLSDWELSFDHALTGATEAFVAAVRCPDGTPAVLKLMIPRPADDAVGSRAAELEATVLGLAGGEGCAALHRRDDERGALLIERLGPSLFDLGLPAVRRHEIMVGCATALWRPIGDDALASGTHLPSGADKAGWLIEATIRWWEALDHPCGERTIEHAIAAAERRRHHHDDERAVLVHGDVHQWNTLQTCDGSGFKLIDPDGLFAEPEYDLGVLMREDPVDPTDAGAAELEARAHQLARWTGLDPAAIWEWGVVERVSTGLICRSIGVEPVGTQMLAVADHLAARTDTG